MRMTAKEALCRARGGAAVAAAKKAMARLLSRSTGSSPAADFAVNRDSAWRYECSSLEPEGQLSHRLWSVIKSGSDEQATPPACARSHSHPKGRSASPPQEIDCPCQRPARRLTASPWSRLGY